MYKTDKHLPPHTPHPPFVRERLRGRKTIAAEIGFVGWDHYSVRLELVRGVPTLTIPPSDRRPARVINAKSPQWSTPICCYPVTGNTLTIIPRRLWRLVDGDTIEEVPDDQKFDLARIGFPSYTITRAGRIWSHQKQQWLNPFSNKGRQTVVLLKSPILLSRVMAEAWIGLPSGYRVVLVSDDSESCDLSKLQWATGVSPGTKRFTGTLTDRERRISQMRIRDARLLKRANVAVSTIKLVTGHDVRLIGI